MNVYASAAASSPVFTAYLHQQIADQNAAITQASLAVDPQAASLKLDAINLNIEYANNVMGLILKQITGLQP